MWNLPGVDCSFLGKARSLCLEATRMIIESLVQMYKSPISSKTNPKECVEKNIELSYCGATSVRALMMFAMMGMMVILMIMNRGSTVPGCDATSVYGPISPCHTLCAAAIFDSWRDEKS